MTRRRIDVLRRTVKEMRAIIVVMKRTRRASRIQSITIALDGTVCNR
jgi:hypothetical protein